MSGVRHADSLPARLLAYFAANPGEELTYPDVCAKFGCSQKHAHSAVHRLTIEERLESVHVVRVKGRQAVSINANEVLQWRRDGNTGPYIVHAKGKPA